MQYIIIHRYIGHAVEEKGIRGGGGREGLISGAGPIHTFQYYYYESNAGTSGALDRNSNGKRITNIEIDDLSTPDAIYLRCTPNENE